MERKLFVTAVACALFMCSTQAAMAAQAQGTLYAASGEEAGKVHLREGKKGVLVHVKASGLTAGAHGVHFHSVGNCSDHHDHFKAAAGHVASTPELAHGLLADTGYHEGDLPNIFASKDGTAEAEFFVANMRLDSLLDKDGAALMIHANPDDHISQPIGGAGDRVACAVVQREAK